MSELAQALGQLVSHLPCHSFPGVCGLAVGWRREVGGEAGHADLSQEDICPDSTVICGQSLLFWGAQIPSTRTRRVVGECDSCFFQILSLEDSVFGVSTLPWIFINLSHY